MAGLPTGAIRGHRLLALGAAALVLCACAGCALLAGQAAAPGGGALFGYSVNVCVGVNTAPRFQAGLTWDAPFLSSLPPVVFTSARVCGWAPWVTALPPRGALVIPP